MLKDLIAFCGHFEMKGIQQAYSMSMPDSYMPRMICHAGSCLPKRAKHGRCDLNCNTPEPPAQNLP